MITFFVILPGCDYNQYDVCCRGELLRDPRVECSGTIIQALVLALDKIGVLYGEECGSSEFKKPLQAAATSLFDDDSTAKRCILAAPLYISCAFHIHGT